MASAALDQSVRAEIHLLMLEMAEQELDISSGNLEKRGNRTIVDPRL